MYTNFCSANICLFLKLRGWCRVTNNEQKIVEVHVSRLDSNRKKRLEQRTKKTIIQSIQQQMFGFDSFGNICAPILWGWNINLS